jgi:hypothetical protein
MREIAGIVQCLFRLDSAALGGRIGAYHRKG